jgi:microcystin-dependent protein
VLSSDSTVIIPALFRRLTVFNVTTGAFNVLLKTPTGAAVCIPQGLAPKDIVCDGVNIRRMDVADIGQIAYFGRPTVPPGWLECDGSAISRTSYPDLFAAIGTTWGAGNGATTFNLPDLKTAGRFIRSRTASVAVGTLQAADIAAHNHTASTTITSITVASDGNHSHIINISDPQHIHIVDKDSNGVAGFYEGNVLNGTIGPAQGRFINYAGGSNAAFRAAAASTGITASSVATGTHSHSGSTGTATTTVNNSSGTETRPINASALACIRY